MSTTWVEAHRRASGSPGHPAARRPRPCTPGLDGDCPATDTPGHNRPAGGEAYSGLGVQLKS